MGQNPGDGKGLVFTGDDVSSKTQGSLVFGVDLANEARAIGITGSDFPGLKVDTELKDLVRELIIQYKINNKILNEVHDLNVNELDVK